MDRRLSDKLIIAVGALVAMGCLVVGVLTSIGASFANSQVHDRLSREQIFFPAKGTTALDPHEFPALQRYASQQVDTGPKAKAYADHFIWVHMMKASGNRTYAQVSAAAAANPNDPKLAALKQTMFQGGTLRTSLLTAYAFGVFGELAVVAAIGSFGLAALLLVAVGLGLWHLGKLDTLSA